MAESDGVKILHSMEMNQKRYLEILGRLIGTAEHLQNSKILGKFAKEDLAGDIVIEYLKPYTEEQGGPLKLERIHFVEGRNNIVVRYPGTEEGSVVSILGAHMDVVPADPSLWERNPFELTVEGDNLYGRGVTDCLGHVALCTELLIQLAEKRPSLKHTVAVIMIANEEEGSVKGIGVDQLVKNGNINFIKGGPVVWIDVADSQPCIGTAGSFTWKLKANGKVGHSGMPNQGINSLEMVTDAVKELQRRFYKDFPPHKREADYHFMVSSTMKPTQISMSNSSVNQIPPWAEITGDLRLIPFYDAQVLMDKLRKHAEDINNNIEKLANADINGAASKYVLEDGTRGTLEFNIFMRAGEGIACSIDSKGYKALYAAVDSIRSDGCRPYSITGSLPCVRELQREGFDVQLIGFGDMSTYHATNERASLSALADGLKICCRFIANLE